MPREVNPCYGCNERTESCHAKCEAYALWVRARDAEYERRNVERSVQWDVNAVNGAHVAKLYKRRKKKVSGQL